MIDTTDTPTPADAVATSSSPQHEATPASAESPAGEGSEQQAQQESKPQKKVEPRHRHFKHLSPRSHQWIDKNCGEWVLDAMRDYLFDPDRVFPDWGTRFAVTLKDIGKEDVVRMGEAEVLYDYVMSTPFWEINYQIRKKLLSAKPSRKRKPQRAKKPAKAPAATLEQQPAEASSEPTPSSGGDDA